MKYLLFLVLISFFVSARPAMAATYSATGTITSVNMLSGAGVKSINKFGYKASLIPVNTGIKVQFSQDGVTWRNSANTVNEWDTLSQGDYLAEGSSIDLLGLNWAGGNFYYQAQFDTANDTATPILDDVIVYYSPGVYLTTQSASNVKPSQAVGNGTIVGISGGNATVRGFTYGLTQADTWDVHEHGSFSTGAYTLNITGLSANTTYFVRAYATNPEGTSYGTWVSFTTGIYAASATVTSTNLLTGQSVTTIDEFDYTLSAKPSGTEATVQFSQNNTSWYSSTGSLNGTDTLNTGSNPINLSRLSWTGANFYYKITLTANTARNATPVLDDASVVINAPSPALVGEWQFDEGQGDTAHNTGTGASLDGTVTNATWSENAKFGKALQFNGTGSYVSVGTAISNIQTISLWVNPKSLTTSLVDFDGGTHTITVSSGVISANGFAVAPLIYVNGALSTTLVTDTWQHILVTYTQPAVFDSTTITLGKVGTGYFKGFMDSVRIYNYALNPDLVKVDYNQGSVRLAEANLNLYNGLVGWWKMDETAGGTAVDSSGNGNSGTYTNGATNATGKFGNGGSFDGSNDQINLASPTPSSSQITISAWVKSTYNGDYQTIVYGSGDYTGIGSIYMREGTFMVYGSTMRNPGGQAASGSWLFVTVTYDNSTKSLKLYRNGYLGYSNTENISWPNNYISQIGRYNSVERPFSGVIDELRVYNRVLSPAEVTQLYEWAPGPVAHWKLDEGSGTSTYDNSGNENTGTLTNSPTWTNGKFGKAVKHDGSDDFVDVGTGPTAVNTVSFWVNPTTTTEYFIDLNGSAYISASGGTVSATGFTSPTIYVNGVATSTVTAGTWQHVTVTTATSLNASDLDIGRIEGVGNLEGMIDDVKIYNYARTQKQIVSDMNASHPSVGSPVGSPVAYYDFDEGQGTTAHNLGNGGSSLNGTLTSGTWNMAGKFGKALSVTASSSVTSTITDPAYSNSVSIWVKPTASVASKTLVTATKLTTSTLSKPVYGGCTGNALNLNAWNHIVAISDGSGVCKIFQDGQLSASGTTGVTFGTSINIGASSFVGDVDEFKLYYYALSPEEVKLDYNRGSALKLGSTGTTSTNIPSDSNTDSYCPPGQGTTCGAPVAEWKMDEGTGTSAFDTSGNANTGSFGAGSAAPTWVNGKIGKGLSFDGVDDFVDVGSGPTAVNTVEFWVKPVTTTEYFVDLNGSAYVSASSGTVSATGFTTPTYYINGVATASPTLTAGGWQHVAVTTGTGFNATDLDLGRIEGVGNLEGQLDQVQLFNYARSAAQVAWDYNRGKPVAYWDFDETSGTTANDASGNGNTGTNTGATITANCKLQNCLSFDGVTSNVAVTSTTSINAVSFWMKQTTTSNKSILYLDGTHSVTLASNVISANGFSSPTIYVDGNAGNTVSDTNWHLVTVISATAFAVANPVIGKVGANYYTGLLDDIRFYNYALTATQVRDLYTGGAVRY